MYHCTGAVADNRKLLTVNPAQRAVNAQVGVNKAELQAQLTQVGIVREKRFNVTLMPWWHAVACICS